MSGLLAAIKDPQFRADVKRGLLDAGNRGAVAATLGAPVDAINGLLNAALMSGGVAGHKLGILRADQMPNPVTMPVGGSEWIGQKMQNAGIVSENRNPVAEALASVAVPAAMNKAGRGLFAAEQRAIENATAPTYLRKESGMFIGPGAKTWDAKAASKAQAMAAKGADPRAIWKETGTFKGPDGMWRQEIPDNEAFYRGSKAASSSYADDVMLHPKLFDSYQGLGNNKVIESQHPGGSYDSASRSITVGPKDSNSIMLHELQHAIQQREGWAKGGSPEMFEGAKKEADELYKLFHKTYKQNEAEYLARTQGMGKPSESLSSLSTDTIKQNMDAAYKELKAAQRQLNANYDPQAMYRNLAGEAEARATQARMNMNAAQRREVFPLDSYDVPVDQLIVRGLLGR
jgi:hypothetical protein